MPIEIFSLVLLLCGDTNYSCTLLALGGKAASQCPGHNPFPLHPGCRACFQGCRPRGAQATCARGTCDGLRGSCLSTRLLQPTEVARHLLVSVWPATWLFHPYFYLWTDFKSAMALMPASYDVALQNPGSIHLVSLREEMASTQLAVLWSFFWTPDLSHIFYFHSIFL